jgi:protein-disulfide isomerase
MKRSSTRWWIAGTIAAAIVVVVVLVVVSARGGETPSRQAPTLDLAGIPQSGQALGAASAPVEIQEFADLQCPYCAQAARETIPPLVERWVRPGTVRISFQPVAFVGPDSVRGATAALAAGQQNRLWQFVEAIYGEQGAENSGWLDDELVGATAAAVGVGRDRFEADRASSSVQEAFQRIAFQAQAAGVRSTPTFVIRGPGGVRVIAGVPGTGDLDAAIEAVR